MSKSGATTTEWLSLVAFSIIVIGLHVAGKPLDVTSLTALSVTLPGYGGGRSYVKAKEAANGSTAA